jgi:hypothetical protein
LRHLRDSEQLDGALRWREQVPQQIYPNAEGRL